MNVAKKHIEGATKILATAGATATRSIVIPLLPAQGSWVITGTVQAVRADLLHGPVTYFPQFTGSCANGVATSNNTGTIPAQPADRGSAQSFQPGGLSLVGADGHGLQIEIALTGEVDVAVCWSWALDVTTVELP
jgi:hypothetical protein